MMRLGVVIALLVLISWGGFYVGQRWDEIKDAWAEADTRERLGNADVSEGDPDDDAAWVSNFLERLRNQ